MSNDRPTKCCFPDCNGVERCSSLHAECVNAARALRAFDAGSAAIDAASIRVQLEAQEAVARAERERDKASEDLTKARDALMLVESERGRLARTSFEDIAQIKRQQDEIDRLKKDLERARADARKKGASRDEAGRRIAELMEQIRELQKDVEWYHEARQGLLVEVGALRGELLPGLEALQEEVGQLKEEIGGPARALSESRAARLSLQDQLDRTLQAYQSEMRCHGEAVAYGRKRQEERDAAIAEAQRLEKLLRVRDAEIEGLEKRVEGQHRRDRALAHWKSRLHKVEAERDRLGELREIVLLVRRELAPVVPNGEHLAKNDVPGLIRKAARSLGIIYGDRSGNTEE